MTEFMLDPVIVDPGRSGSERVMHNALYDHIYFKFPMCSIDYEANWPVGRPDLVLTTEYTPSFRTVSIIELKRDVANRAAVAQLRRYMDFRLGLAATEQGLTMVTGILAAPSLRSDVVLGPDLLYLPIVWAETP